DEGHLLQLFRIDESPLLGYSICDGSIPLEGGLLSNWLDYGTKPDHTNPLQPRSRHDALPLVQYQATQIQTSAYLRELPELQPFHSRPLRLLLRSSPIIFCDILFPNRFLWPPARRRRRA